MQNLWSRLSMDQSLDIQIYGLQSKRATSCLVESLEKTAQVIWGQPSRNWPICQINNTVSKNIFQTQNSKNNPRTICLTSTSITWPHMELTLISMRFQSLSSVPTNVTPNQPIPTSNFVCSLSSFVQTRQACFILPTLHLAHYFIG